MQSPEVTSKLKPDDFITVITNLAHGLAVTQRILGAELSQKSTRNLVQSLFDHLIYLPPIGSRFVAIAVVGGTGERGGSVFENRDIRAMALRVHHHTMTLAR